MSRDAVIDRLRCAGVKTDCGALRTLAVAAARMTNDARSWTHAGILYRWKKDVRFFELKTHQKLQDEPIKDEPAGGGLVCLASTRNYWADLAK